MSTWTRRFTIDSRACVSAFATALSCFARAAVLLPGVAVVARFHDASAAPLTFALSADAAVLTSADAPAPEPEAAAYVCAASAALLDTASPDALSPSAACSPE